MLGAAIGAVLSRPMWRSLRRRPTIGFIHRKLPDADIYFVANTDNRPHAFDATFRGTRPAQSGGIHSPEKSRRQAQAARSTSISLRTSRAWSSSSNITAAGAEKPIEAAQFAPIDLTHDWKVTFDKTGATETMQACTHGRTIEAEKYYSGAATYERTVEIPDSVAHAGAVLLDFGEGTPVARTTLHQAGMRAWYDPPLREAALVYVNGKLAGSVWHPPYRIDIAPLLHPGANELKIVVANTAINELAGRAAPDYRLLNLRYGEKFTPQDMDHLEPLPSGIVGPLRLISGPDADKEANRQ